MASDAADRPRASGAVADASSTLEQRLREVNERLMISAVRQHELAEQAAKAEAGLRASEARLQAALDAAGLGTWNLDVETSRFVSDARFEAIFGISVGGLTQEQALANIHPEDRDRVTAEVVAAMRADDPILYDVEYRIIHPDGKLHWVYARGRATFTDEASGRRLESFGGTVADITERKLAEAVVRVQEERLRLLGEAAGVLLSTDDPAAILHGLLERLGPQLGADAFFNFMTDDGGRSLRLESFAGIADESAQSLARLELSEAISETVALTREPWHAVEIQQSEDPKLQSAKALGLRALDCNPLTSGTELLGTLAFASRSKDRFEPDELSFLRTISHYVTLAYARQRGAEALRRSAQSVRFVMDSAPLKIFTAGMDGSIDYFNPQWMEFTGLAFEQIKGWGWTQCIHPDDLEENVRIWRHSVDSGEPFQFEHRFRRADGTYRWHVSRALPMRDQTGRVVLWVGANTDVDDLLQSEQALKESELRYRRLFQAAGDGILVIDALTGKIIEANRFMSLLLGFELHEFVGKALHEIGIFADLAANTEAFETLREKGYLRIDNLLVRPQAGAPIPVEFVSNVYIEDQRLVAQCNVRDISVRAAMEQQIKEQALALAAEDQRKDEFMAMLSHELRNPLAAIRSATHLLHLEEHGVENPGQRQARDVIERQVGHLARLVDDLMEVSRVVSGKIRLISATVDLCEAARRALETAAPLLARKRHELSLILPAEPVWVNADVTRLDQVIVNLLNNAAKFTAPGGQLSLSVERRHQEAELRVRDSGTGIAPQMLERVFDLFTQADRSLAHAEGGLGIGLSLVQKLVKLHGGTVEAHSAGLGQGSEFVVRLPVLAPTSTPAEAPAAVVDDRESKVLRVLVVDDNVDGCKLLSAIVQHQGYAVQTAFTGPAAVEAATTWRPDVVLLDIGLPDLDGYEVASRLRADPANAAMKLVAVSGYGREEDLKRGREAGFDVHLVKPIDLAEVERLLRSWSVRPAA